MRVAIDTSSMATLRHVSFCGVPAPTVLHHKCCQALTHVSRQLAFISLDAVYAVELQKLSDALRLGLFLITRMHVSVQCGMLSRISTNCVDFRLE